MYAFQQSWLHNPPSPKNANHHVVISILKQYQIQPFAGCLHVGCDYENELPRGPDVGVDPNSRFFPIGVHLDQLQHPTTQLERFKKTLMMSFQDEDASFVMIKAGRFADVAYDPGSIAVSVVVGEENRIFSQGIRRSKEWKDKLPNVVLKAEEIVYSKANSEGRELEAGNVLLLRNQLTLSSDWVEVSQEKLLSLVAERLIDANSNVNNKDAGYVENQQQNIGDAIDLLPRLTTGINVNLKFTRIDDFEFTRECGIFDLLDIPLCHGWIVDPQDSDTASAIRCKSYNTLMGELVALDTEIWESDLMNCNNDCVDFAAATTASLGIPSPSLTRHMSFDDSPIHHSVSEEKKVRRGDLEEEEELLRTLKQSETEISPPTDYSYLKQQEPAIPMEVHTGAENDESYRQKSLIVDDNETLNDNGDDLTTFETDSRQNACPSSQCENDTRREQIEAVSEKHAGKDEFEKASVDALVKSEKAMEDSDTLNAIPPPVNTTFETASRQNACPSSQCDNDKRREQIEAVSEKHEGKDEFEKASIDALVKSEKAMEDSDTLNAIPPPVNTTVHNSGDEKIQDQSAESNDLNIVRTVDTVGETSDISCQSASPIEELESFKDLVQHINESCSTSSADGSEPIYEGEEYVQERITTNYDDQEPMYEGEVVLAEQVTKVSSNADETKGKSGITPRQGDLIRKFLKSNANQLTIYGLFCLQEGLKERELCVFFRNNHFNTMFKYEGELYLLATDQGYIRQPDLVWEKLDEVNGNTVYMTGSFKDFNAENPETRSWDEQNAFANTAEYIASIDDGAQEDASFSSDLRLAIALQQEEFEQQQQQWQQQQPQRSVPQPNTSREPDLVTGPQNVQPSRPKNSSSSKQESKSSKDKCHVM
ncbi:ubiquitin carboxyl-terminal hydrolase MINDY-1 isoform X1 [Tanacetum coccineum]